jgi:hypothetical protein
MPAKGRIAEKALKKYGPRSDDRSIGRKNLFQRIQNFVSEEGIIATDMNPQYPNDIKNFWPKRTHIVHRSRKACVVGQGELKSGGFDPLFSFNHTAAMIRANVSRLFRKTWNTTKDPERLNLHLAMYALFHNRYVIQNPS